MLNHERICYSHINSIIVKEENAVRSPSVFNTQVGDEIADLLERTTLVPSLGFIDPWGYKGLTSRLIKAMIKDFGLNFSLSNPGILLNSSSKLFANFGSASLNSATIF